MHSHPAPPRVVKAQAACISRGLRRQRERKRSRSAVPTPGVARVPALGACTSRCSIPNSSLRRAEFANPFSRSEIGLHKSAVLANRVNLFWGLDWEGIPERLDPKRKVTGVDIVIGWSTQGRQDEQSPNASKIGV